MKSRILISAIVFFLAMTACRGTFQIGMEHSTPRSTPQVQGTPTILPTTLNSVLSGTPIPTGNIIYFWPRALPTGLALSQVYSHANENGFDLLFMDPSQSIVLSLEGGSEADLTNYCQSYPDYPSTPVTVRGQAGCFPGMPGAGSYVEWKENATHYLVGGKGISNEVALATAENLESLNLPAFLVRLATDTTLVPSTTAQWISPTPSSLPAGNIIMAAGTTAGVVQGTILPGGTTAYTLSASQSQPLILILDSPNHDVTLGVFEPNGHALLNPANKLTSWQGLLPQTETYTIMVSGGATAENYTLTAKAAQLVNFAAGTSSITLKGTTLKGYVFSYALTGSAGQTMTATLNVPSGTATIDIFGLASGSLLSSTARSSTWTGILPQTQDYVIEVIPTNGQVVNYNLTVSIGPTAGNIVMETGTTAGIVQGAIQPGQIITYTLNAGQYQPMVLIMNSPNNDVTLGVFEPNGNMLLNPANLWTRWQGVLPQTEQYKIQVIGGATAENFTLTAKVPQQINYVTGTSSTSLNGTTVSGYVFSYAVSANAAQTMTVTLNVPSSTAYIDIFGLASGTILSPSAKATSWTGVLPQTQDYVIEVIPNNGAVVDYGLTVAVH
jgi:hypothetical protein